jgi:hypothetical protein
MFRRRLFRLLVLGACGWAVAMVVKVLRGDPAPVFSGTQTGPPPDPGVPAPVVAPARVAAPWVEAGDPSALPGHPVKAKLKSGIYHLPGMLNYDRTVPDRWYRDAASAEADGLRAAKR